MLNAVARVALTVLVVPVALQVHLLEAVLWALQALVLTPDVTAISLAPLKPRRLLRVLPLKQVASAKSVQRGPKAVEKRARAVKAGHAVRAVGIVLS